jgi:death on curing protein
MKQPRWLSIELVLAIHEEQLAEHGGGTGLRDRGLLESALAHPRQVHSYAQPTPDVAALAAAYGTAMAKFHPFVDGNKRTALVLTETFLDLNGAHLITNDIECVETFLALAAGDLSESGLADWIRQRIRYQTTTSSKHRVQEP